jgi:putative PIN family toxin of toxin-antitoxin system
MELVAQGTVTPVLSIDIVAEIRDVLTRPKLVAKYPALTTTAVDAFLSDCIRQSKWIDPLPEHYVLTRDPKDSKYLNVAIEARSPYLVTDDNDLLELMDQATVVGQDFQAKFPTISIMRPPEFIAAITASPP